MDSVLNLLELSKDAVFCAYEKLIELDKKEVKNYVFSSEIPKEAKAIADKIIEDILINKLSIAGLNMLSEESGLLRQENNSKLHFVIDPIDGTINFVRGISTCSISVALYDGEVPLFGVIASYPKGNIAWGGKKVGAFIGNLEIKVSTINNSENGILCTGFPSRFQFNYESINKQMTLMKKFGKVRMLGSASQSLLYVAQGSADAYAENEIMLWDVAAGLAILEGAGGSFSLKPGSNKYALNVVASNGHINIGN